MTRASSRRKNRSPQTARALATEARDVLDGAVRERNRSERVAAILAQKAAVRAADAICTKELGYHAHGGNHAEAIKVLAGVRGGNELAKKLRTILSDKSEIGYDIAQIKHDRFVRIMRNTQALVEESEHRVRA